MAAAIPDYFLSTLQTSPQNFLQPSLPLYTDSVAYLKHILDPLAQDVSAEQQRRQQEARKKRKRGQQHADDDEEVLRLKQIHAEGFGIEQVWEQARRVIDAARTEAERSFAELETLQNGSLVNGKTLRESSDLDATSESDHEDLGIEGVDYEVEGPDEGSSAEEYENGVDEMDEEDALEDGEDDYDDLNGDSEEEEPSEEFVADKFGLNDGFFSIDSFNKQSEFLEQQDTRGEQDDAASDEEDIDWDMNPLTAGVSAAVTNGINGNEVAEESGDEDDENGPTFGDPDAPSEDEDEVDGGDLDDIGGMSNANDLMYTDFFAPPAQKKKKTKTNKPRKRVDAESNGTQPLAGVEDDMERTMAAVHRDLFEDEASEEEEADDAPEELDRSDPRGRRSTHERRQAAIAEEIRKLEAANVAKRKWTLSGEARAADRPMNSLLEEDVEFERTGKPVPVITADVSESIEELIKRRILAFDFQDIARRRPDDLATGTNGRRGRVDFELDDSKSKKGLAEEYEEEHLRRTDPNFVDVDDEKMGKEQKAIEALWKEVAGQLDSLSSWHFRPKPAAPQLDIRVHAPTIAMEDARPNAGGEVAAASQLAPQEVYRVGDASKGVHEEVAGKSGLPAAREELSREERRRRRRRDKERIRKASGNGDAKTESKAAKDKKAVLDDLKRGGVKVIGKKGEVQDVEGRNVRKEGSGQGAARYKL